jgi:predicted dehydrogenase
MSPNPVITLLGRRLRLAVIGGGPGSFIGAMHRQAARLDDRYELVAAALTSNPETSVAAGRAIGLPAARCHADGESLIAAQAALPEGADVVAIMTPNDSHFRYASLALRAGLDVVCDKPMTNTLAEAHQLHQLVQDSGRVFCLTHNYSGYPLVRQARAMVAQGDLGEIRLVQVEYVQGGRARPGPGRRAWKEDPARGGPSLVMGDIGTHAHQLLRFITGLEVALRISVLLPNRLSIRSTASSAVRLRTSSAGLSSTMSSEASRPVSAIISMHNWASR